MRRRSRFESSKARCSAGFGLPTSISTRRRDPYTLSRTISTEVARRTHHHPVGSRLPPGADRERIPVAQASAEADGEAELLAHSAPAVINCSGVAARVRSSPSTSSGYCGFTAVLTTRRTRRSSRSVNCWPPGRMRTSAWRCRRSFSWASTMGASTPWTDASLVAACHRGSRSSNRRAARSPQQLPRRHSPAAPAPEPDPGVREDW